MRDFSWNYFTMTGDVESYLLYKEINVQAEPTEDELANDVDDEVELQ
ncbi:MAG: YqzL-like protein [Paenibacillus sp.]|nr:YqzL-like protein [Paenibacillus sp.]